MEKPKKICSNERKRKRETEREKLEFLENKLQQQEALSEELKESIDGIFKRLSVIQDLLVRNSSLERHSWTRPSSEPSGKQHPVNKDVKDGTFLKINKDNAPWEISSQTKWNKMHGTNDVIDIYRSQMQQPSAYIPLSRGETHTVFGSSIHSVLTNDAMPSFLTCVSSFGPSALQFGGISGAGTGGGGGGGGTNRGDTYAPPITTEPECGGGVRRGCGGGTASVNPVKQTYSPCDCTAARQFCKCRQGGAAPSTLAGRPQLPVQTLSPSIISGASSSRNVEGSPLTDNEKATCICKGSGKIRRLCPLKAKRRLQREKSVGGKGYGYAEAQQFKDKELENVFDTKSEPEVHLASNEQQFKDVFPELNGLCDCSRCSCMEWPMPFTPMQDYSGIPSDRFAEPFKFTEKELGKAFEEEEIPNVELKDTECVFMDQFPGLASRTNVPRAGAPMTGIGACRTPGQSAASLYKCPSVASAMNNAMQSKGTPQIVVSSNALPGSGMHTKGNVSPCIASQTSRQICTDGILAECDCMQCAATKSPTGAGKNNMSGDFIPPKSPQSHLTPGQGSQCSTQQQQSLRSGLSNTSGKPASPVGETFSQCSCNPCPSIVGDQGYTPSNALTPTAMSGISSASCQPTIKPSPNMVSMKSVGTQASREICQQQPLHGCECKPTCSDRKVLLQSGDTGKITGQGVGIVICPPAGGSSSTQLIVTGSGDPQQWSDKELAHAFSEEDIPNVKLGPNDAIFMREFPALNNVRTFIRTPQPLPFTPQQDFSRVAKERFSYPEKFSDEELKTAFEEEEIPALELGDVEGKSMSGVSESLGYKAHGQSGCASKRGGSGKPCRCYKRVVQPCKCKPRGN